MEIWTIMMLKVLAPAQIQLNIHLTPPPGPRIRPLNVWRYVRTRLCNTGAVSRDPERPDPGSLANEAMDEITRDRERDARSDAVQRPESSW